MSNRILDIKTKEVVANVIEVARTAIVDNLSVEITSDKILSPIAQFLDYDFSSTITKNTITMVISGFSKTLSKSISGISFTTSQGTLTANQLQARLYWANLETPLVA